MTELVLNKILYVEDRTSKEGNPYKRVVFLTDDNRQARLSIAPQQWTELKEKVSARLLDDEETIVIDKPLTLIYEEGAKTIKGKLFVSHEVGARDNMKYDFLELSPALFITNEIITQLVFKRNLKASF